MLHRGFPASVNVFKDFAYFLHEIWGTEDPWYKALRRSDAEIQDSNTHGTTGISIELRC